MIHKKEFLHLQFLKFNFEFDLHLLFYLHLLTAKITSIQLQSEEDYSYMPIIKNTREGIVF